MAKFEIGVPLASEPEAKAAAKAQAKKMKRDTVTGTCSVVGDPTVRQGAVLVFQDVRGGIDGKKFVITSTRHSFTKQGYTTTADLELKV